MDFAFASLKNRAPTKHYNKLKLVFVLDQVNQTFSQMNKNIKIKIG